METVKARWATSAATGLVAVMVVTVGVGVVARIERKRRAAAAVATAVAAQRVWRVRRGPGVPEMGVLVVQVGSAVGAVVGAAGVTAGS